MAPFPAVPVTAGADDPPGPTWHERVVVDLLEQAQEGDSPILLRVYADQGHGTSGLPEMCQKTANMHAVMATATVLKI